MLFILLAAISNAASLTLLPSPRILAFLNWWSLIVIHFNSSTEDLRSGDGFQAVTVFLVFSQACGKDGGRGTDLLS